MTAGTIYCFYGMLWSLKNFLMTANALVFHYRFIKVLYPNGIQIISGGKGIRMKKTIDSF